jgi:hypothetical protein
MRPPSEKQYRALGYLVQHGEARAEDLAPIIKDEIRCVRDVMLSLIIRGLATAKVRKETTEPTAKTKQHQSRYTIYYPTEEGIQACQKKRTSSNASSKP